MTAGRTARGGSLIAARGVGPGGLSATRAVFHRQAYQAPRPAGALPGPIQ